MADKRASAGSKIVTALVGAGAAFVARKLLSFGWTKITGKEPPEHPEDPQVALSEALIWGIVLGAGVHTARLLATRATDAPPGRARTDHRPGTPSATAAAAPSVICTASPPRAVEPGLTYAGLAVRDTFLRVRGPHW